MKVYDRMCWEIQSGERTFSMSLSLARFVPRAGTEEFLSSLPLPEPMSDDRFFLDLEAVVIFEAFDGF